MNEILSEQKVEENKKQPQTEPKTNPVGRLLTDKCSLKGESDGSNVKGKVWEIKLLERHIDPEIWSWWITRCGNKAKPELPTLLVFLFALTDRKLSFSAVNLHCRRFNQMLVNRPHLAKDGFHGSAVHHIHKVLTKSLSWSRLVYSALLEGTSVVLITYLSCWNRSDAWWEREDKHINRCQWLSEWCISAAHKNQLAPAPVELCCHPPPGRVTQTEPPLLPAAFGVKTT